MGPIETHYVTGLLGTRSAIASSTCTVCHRRIEAAEQASRVPGQMERLREVLNGMMKDPEFMARVSCR